MVKHVENFLGCKFQTENGKRLVIQRLMEYGNMLFIVGILGTKLYQLKLATNALNLGLFKRKFLNERSTWQDRTAPRQNRMMKDISLLMM